jgi:hypothetical protein
MLEQVALFQSEVVGLEIPDKPQGLIEERLFARHTHIQEELEELLASNNQLDEVATIDEQADAFIDIIYIALGGLIEMGIVPGPVFDEVHKANMAKRRGSVPSRPGNNHDAVKPEGWSPPDVANAICAMSVLKHISQVHLEIAELRRRKGQDYNSSVQLEDYFPMGHLSYFQMMHLKAKRAKSLIEVIQSGGEPNFEGLRDTLLDALNYITFWVEAIDKETV